MQREYTMLRIVPQPLVPHMYKSSNESEEIYRAPEFVFGYICLHRVIN